MFRTPMRRQAAIFSAFALIGAVTTEARAQQCSNPLTSTCINSDTYWPHAGPQRFGAVGGTETVQPGQVAFGLIADYQSRPVLITSETPGPPGTKQYAVDNQVNGNFLFAYGVTNQLQLDVALPVTLVQDGVGTSPLTGGRALRNTAVRDMRFGLAYAIIPRLRLDPDVVAQDSGTFVPGKNFSVLARMEMSAPIGDNTDFAGERTAVYAPSISADYRIWKLFFGAEVGARIRPTTEFAGARIGPELTTALGAGYEVLPHEKLSVMLEGRIYPNFAEQHDTEPSVNGVSSTPNGKHIAPAEWLLGVRSAPVLAGDISFYAGGGGPIPISDDPITVPRFRFMLGVTYAPMGRDTDGDGILDRNDACPNQKGAPGFQPAGCAPLPGESLKGTSE